MPEMNGRRFMIRVKARAHGVEITAKLRGLVGVAAVLLAGCAGPVVKGVRVVDDVGMPVAGAAVQLSYSVPYTVMMPVGVVTDVGGYAEVRDYRLSKQSFATVTTSREIVSFKAAQFGALRDGVITLAMWRGLKSGTWSEGADGGLNVPSIYLLKGEN